VQVARQELLLKADRKGNLNSRLAAAFPSPVPIQKSADAVDPSEYRPITVSSMVCRLFHRLVARRAECSSPGLSRG